MQKSLDTLENKPDRNHEDSSPPENIECESSACGHCGKVRLELETTLQEAAAETRRALEECAAARNETALLAAEAETLKGELLRARISAELALEAQRAGCDKPFDLLQLAGCGGVAFDAEGALCGVREWLKRAREERAYMFNNMKAVLPPLYLAGANAEDQTTNGVLAGAARRYDGQ